MKVFLLYRDRDFDPQQKLPVNEPALTQDLELNTLFDVMAKGDQFLYEIARKTVLSSLSDPDTILYRQDILKDCLKIPSIAKDIYDIAVESIESKKNIFYWVFSHASPSSTCTAPGFLDTSFFLSGPGDGVLGGPLGSGLPGAEKAIFSH